MNAVSEPVEIPLSKKKIILLLAGALLFVAIGAWFILAPPPARVAPVTLRLAGLAAVLFFGFAAYQMFQKLPQQKPGLMVAATGITDFTTGKAPVHIPWADVEDLWVLRIQNKKLIMVQVRNPEDYIAQQKGIRRKMMQLNHKMYGTPLSITANALKISFDKLWQVLAEQFKETHGL